MELFKSFKIDSVSRLQPTPPRCISPDTPVAEAVSMMRQERVGCLLVLENRELLGILTERDIMRRVMGARLPLTTTIRQCMTRNPVTVGCKETISAALRRMEEGGYRHLPVVDEAARVVGILSVKRIVHYLVEHFPNTVYNLPPDPNAVHQSREGA
jgi:CBS domain-containing protein